MIDLILQKIVQEIEKLRIVNGILIGILCGVIIGILTVGNVGSALSIIFGILAGFLVVLIVSNAQGSVLGPVVLILSIIFIGFLGGIKVGNIISNELIQMPGIVSGIILGILSAIIYGFVLVILNKLLEITGGRAFITRFSNNTIIFTLRRNNLLSFFCLPIIIYISWYLVHIIKLPIQEQKRIDRVEAKVIAKLKLIRNVQLAYMSVNGEYAHNWNKLIDFVNNDNFYITERKEYIITFTYGADSIVVKKDTLAIIPVRDSLFSKEKYPDFDPATLPLIPESDSTFVIFADRISKSGVLIEVFEVIDTDPVNPKRRRNNNENALKIGSMIDVTTAGNWE